MHLYIYICVCVHACFRIVCDFILVSEGMCIHIYMHTYFCTQIDWHIYSYNFNMFLLERKTSTNAHQDAQGMQIITCRGEGLLGNGK